MSDDDQQQLPSEDVVRALVQQGIEQIQLQKEDIELRREELAVQERDSERQFEYAKEVLAAQKGDQGEDRLHRRKVAIWRYVFVLLSAAISITAILILAYMGKDQLVKELVQMVTAFVAGGLSGYSVGKVRREKKDAGTDNGQGE